MRNRICLRFKKYGQSNELKSVVFAFEGIQAFEVLKAKLVKSVSLYRKLRVTLKVNHGKQTHIFNDFIREDDSYKLKKFCKAIGLRESYAKGFIRLDDLAQKKGWVRLCVRQSSQRSGPYRLEVNGYLPRKRSYETKT